MSFEEGRFACYVQIDWKTCINKLKRHIIPLISVCESRKVFLMLSETTFGSNTHTSFHFFITHTCIYPLSLSHTHTHNTQMSTTHSTHIHQMSHTSMQTHHSQALEHTHKVGTCDHEEIAWAWNGWKNVCTGFLLSFSSSQRFLSVFVHKSV